MKFTIRYKMNYRSTLFTYKKRIHDCYFNWEYETIEEARRVVEKLAKLNPDVEYFKIYQGTACVEKI